MSEPDLFDRIAQQAFHAERKCVAPEIAEPMAYADAFRAEFSQRKCVACKDDGLCMIQRAAWTHRRDDLPVHTFSCSLWSPKAAER